MSEPTDEELQDIADVIRRQHPATQSNATALDLARTIYPIIERQVLERAAVAACNCGTGASKIHGAGCKYYDVLNLNVKDGAG